ncbi:hypothetical protein PG994_004646 [Apiospora phragmitis]|uniref:Lipase n=1 Tax=Apiospora phragmitis TaxID=2905665 RepID=A0ABR1VSD0_9PEZI
MRCSAGILALAAVTNVHAGLVVKPHQHQHHGDLVAHRAVAKREPGLLGLVNEVTGLLSLDDALQLLDDVTDPVLQLDILDRVRPRRGGAAREPRAGPIRRARCLRHSAAQPPQSSRQAHQRRAPRQRHRISSICPRALLPPRGAAARRPPHPRGLHLLRASRPSSSCRARAPTTGSVFAPNLRKLLGNVGYADPVWLNVPHAMLGDAQQSAEYIAYAVHYVSAITSKGASARKDISLITWSQGGLRFQWALTFWPSTRARVANLLAVAADFRGTTCQASCVTRPRNNKTTTPRSSGRCAGTAAAAPVPTTSLYSGFLDEMVQPQQGASASAHLDDTRKVGVANVEVQQVCGPGTVGAGFYEHAGILMHALTHSLIVDALTYNDDGGPADPSRLDLGEVCARLAAPVLGLADVVATEALMVTGAALFLLGYPALFPYAAAAPAPASSSSSP